MEKRLLFCAKTQEINWTVTEMAAQPAPAAQVQATVQWFYERREKWEAFGEIENDELEAAHMDGDDRVDFGGGRYPAILSRRVQENHDANSKRNILRGTWFFQRSDGTVYPYPEDIAAALDDAFARPWVEAGGVPVGDNRVVYRAVEAHQYAQVHTETNTLRWVTRSYTAGALPMKVVEARDSQWLASAHAQAQNQERGSSVDGAGPRVWYFQRGNGSLQEYASDVCDALNVAYPKGEIVLRGAGVGVNVDGKRRVFRAVEGGWAQVHRESQTVRWVTDVFHEGCLPMREVTPMIDALCSDSASFLSWSGRLGPCGDGEQGTPEGSSLVEGAGYLPPSVQVKLACRTWWRNRARWGAKGDYLFARNEQHRGLEQEVVSVTEGEAVRILVDEWEDSAGDIESDAAASAATALMTIASGLTHHSTYSEGRQPLQDTMMAHGITLADARRTLFLSGDRLNEVALWMQITEQQTGWSAEEEQEVYTVAGQMWKAAQVFISLGARARRVVSRLLQLPHTETTSRAVSRESSRDVLPPTSPSVSPCWRVGAGSSSNAVASPGALMGTGCFGGIASPLPADPASPTISGGGRGGFVSRLSSPMSAAVSLAPSLPISAAVVSTAQALALWTRTDGVCCWLLTPDGACNEGPRFLSEEVDLEADRSMARRSLLLLKCSVERRHAGLARAAASLVGSLLACHNCREKLQAHLDELGHDLVEARAAFADDVMCCRMIARALHYLFDYIRRKQQCDKESGDSFAAEVGEADLSGKHRGSFNRRKRLALSKGLDHSSSARRSRSPHRLERHRSSSGAGQLDRHNSGGSDTGSGGMAAAAARARDAVARNKTGDASPASSALRREESNVSTVTTGTNDSFVEEWDLVQGLVALFELAKGRDACAQAWAARGLRVVFSIMASSSDRAERAEDARNQTLIKAALAERRTTLLLKLVNHPSPLVSADAMQCLALLTGVRGATTKRPVYLSGVTYSVVAQGMRGLPCVTSQAARLMANLSRDPANVENFLEPSNPSFKFIAFLSNVGSKLPPISIKFVGLWNDETSDRAMPGQPVRLGEVTRASLVAKLSEVIDTMRSQGVEQGFFALQDYDEFYFSSGPTRHHQRFGQIINVGAGEQLATLVLDEDPQSPVVGSVTVVGRERQNAVYHIEGVRQQWGDEIVCGHADKDEAPEKAWGQRGAAVYDTAKGLDLVPWQADDILISDARKAGLEALANMALHCSTEALSKSLIDAGALDLLLEMCSRDPPLEVDDLFWVANAVASICKAAMNLVKRGAECALTLSLLGEVRDAVKVLLAYSNDDIQSEAAAILVAINMMHDAVLEGDGETNTSGAPDTPPLPPAPPSRETSGLGCSSEGSQGSVHGGRGAWGRIGAVESKALGDSPTNSQNSPSDKQVGGKAGGTGRRGEGLSWVAAASTAVGELDQSHDSVPSVRSDSYNSRRSDSYNPVADGERGQTELQKSNMAQAACQRQSSRVFESNINDEHSSRNGEGAGQQTGTSSKKRWQLGPCLGKGAFAEVYQGIDTETGKFIAVKQVTLKNEASAAAKALRREIDLLCGLPDFKHVVKYLGTEQTQDSSRLFIFLEYVSGGSVSDMLTKFGGLHESIVRKYTYQVLLGLEFLHEHKIVHCDIKGGNILVSEDGVIKLADFNSSKLIGDISWGGNAPLRSIAGTPQFMAPEVIRQSGHGAKADIWSVGCTVIQMITAAAPWNDVSNTHAIFRQVGSGRMKPSYPSDVSADCTSLLDACFQLDADARPSASELKRHAFFANLDLATI